MRAEDRRTISCWRLAVALPHSAISATERPQPMQTLELASSAQISLQGDSGRWVIALSGIEPVVPPDWRRQFVGDFCSVRMRGIDQDISVQPRRYRRDEHNCRTRLFHPSKAKAFANGFALAVPPWISGGVEYLVAGAVRDRDAYIMLIGRQHRTRMNQLFEHRGRIIFGCVDHRAGRCIPPPRIEPRSLAIIDWIRALWITNPKTCQDAVSLLAAHTPPL